jgi:tRNA-specific 2-thiouridylase
MAQAEPGIAPGQACVFYERQGRGARVLGGGFIVSASTDTAGAATALSGT